MDHRHRIGRIYGIAGSLTNTPVTASPINTSSAGCGSPNRCADSQRGRCPDRHREHPIKEEMNSPATAAQECRSDALNMSGQITTTPGNDDQGVMGPEQGEASGRGVPMQRLGPLQ